MKCAILVEVSPQGEQVLLSASSECIEYSGGGPQAPGFNGELVSMLMTLKNYNLSNTSFSFIYNGNSFTGTYKKAFINFGPPIDLGIKAAALGSLLENADCSGDIRFITSEDIIADC